MLENGKNACDCRKKSCPRFGNCKECIEYHKTSKYEPYCKRKKAGLIGNLLKSK